MDLLNRRIFDLCRVGIAEEPTPERLTRQASRPPAASTRLDLTGSDKPPNQPGRPFCVHGSGGPWLARRASMLETECG